MAEEEKKRKVNRTKKEDKEKITNELFMPFEDAIKNIVKVRKEDIDKEEKP